VLVGLQFTFANAGVAALIVVVVAAAISAAVVIIIKSLVLVLFIMLPYYEEYLFVSTLTVVVAFIPSVSMKNTTVLMAVVLAVATVLAAGLTVLPSSIHEAQANPCSTTSEQGVGNSLSSDDYRPQL
jgi:hypothetical protein